MKKKIVLPPDHKILTRRDLIAHGLVTAGGAMGLPSLLSLLSPTAAHAAEVCDPLVGHNRIPFIVFDCAGGIGMSGSWMEFPRPSSPSFFSGHHPPTTRLCSVFRAGLAGRWWRPR